jgi:hypothetical protein
MRLSEGKVPIIAVISETKLPAVMPSVTASRPAMYTMTARAKLAKSCTSAELSDWVDATLTFRVWLRRASRDTRSNSCACAP